MFIFFFSFGILSPRRHYSTSSNRGTRSLSLKEKKITETWYGFGKDDDEKIPEIFRDLISIGNFKNFFHFASVCRFPILGDTSGLSSILSFEIFPFFWQPNTIVLSGGTITESFYLFLLSFLGDIDSGETKRSVARVGGKCCKITSSRF